MSRPVIVAKYANGALGATSVSVPNVQIGDWLIACQATAYSPNYTMPTPTGSGSGTYTEIGTRVGTVTDQNMDMRAWRKECTTAGSHSVSVTDPATSSENMLVVVHLRGAVSIDGTPSAGAAAQTYNATTQQLPAVSPTTADALLLGFWTGVQFSADLAYTPPSGMTEELEYQVNQYVAVMCASQALTAAGSTGTRTATTNPAAAYGWAGKLFAVAGKQYDPKDLTDAGVGSDSATVGQTRIGSLTDAGAGSDAVALFRADEPITDAGTGAEAITIDVLDPIGPVTDGGTGLDAVEVVLFDANDLPDAGTGDDPATVDRLTFVPVTDAGASTEDLLLRQDKTLTDAGTGTDLITLAGGPPAVTDQGYGSEFVRVVDIPFTHVLPLAQCTLYELVAVARVPQVQGPPAFIEVDSIEWKDLRYTNTLSQPQELETSCQLSSVPESILQRLRRPHENATELWLYRNGQIVFAGPLAGWRTSGESLSLSAKGLLVYLRLMEITSDLVFTQADQFTFVKTMVDAWQVLDFGNFGIDTSAVGLSGVLRDGTYLKVELHNVGQRVEELGKRENGFDAEADPATRKLQLWYPTKGVDRSSGEDAIVVDARNITNGDTMCSVAIGDLASEAFGTGSSAGGDATLWSEQSNVELRSRYGRSAVTGTWSDVSEQPTLDAHTRGLLDARKEALIVPGPAVRVTPDADLDDYAVGDTITYDLAGVLGVSGAFRIRRQSVSVSSAGQESVDLEFV